MSKSDDMLATMIANIEKNTGKPVDYWVKLVRDSGLEKHGQKMTLLKQDHGFTHGFANLVVQMSKEDSAINQGDDDLIAAQYAGPKADLKPIHDHIMGIVAGFGSGLEIAPKKTYVSLRHKKQFALVQPSTRTRVDLGLNLKGKAPEGALEASGSFNSMVSHRVRLSSVEDVDAEVKGWLKEAFDAAG